MRRARGAGDDSHAAREGPPKQEGGGAHAVTRRYLRDSAADARLVGVELHAGVVAAELAAILAEVRRLEEFAGVQELVQQRASGTLDADGLISKDLSKFSEILRNFH